MDAIFLIAIVFTTIANRMPLWLLDVATGPFAFFVEQIVTVH